MACRTLESQVQDLAARLDTNAPRVRLHRPQDSVNALDALRRVFHGNPFVPAANTS